VWRELEFDDAKESLVPEDEAEESHGVTVVVVVPPQIASAAQTPVGVHSAAFAVFIVAWRAVNAAFPAQAVAWFPTQVRYVLVAGHTVAAEVGAGAIAA